MAQRIFSVMADADTQAYSVGAAGAQFEVRDKSGRVIVTCGDKGSASNYAVLVNEAYRCGYREGYRRGRASSGAKDAR